MDLKTLLLGEENWSFLAETAFRTCIMFVIILTSLRLLGKRGIKQLSVFELGVIIGLGSAAGDPMFYKDVGLLPGIVVFIIVVSLYRFITHLINKYRGFEHLVEGKAVCIIEEGKFIVENFKKESIAHDELFTQLRLHSIAHLGQVETAIIENNGEVSVYFYPEKEVKYGLPILPGANAAKTKIIVVQDVYACTFCGHCLPLEPAPQAVCSRCGKDEWMKASNKKRQL
jgi:uncharacterized membrane protein YcaP (DUF421 family)